MKSWKASHAHPAPRGSLCSFLGHWLHTVYCYIVPKRLNNRYEISSVCAGSGNEKNDEKVTSYFFDLFPSHREHPKRGQNLVRLFHNCGLGFGGGENVWSHIGWPCDSQCVVGRTLDPAANHSILGDSSHQTWRLNFDKVEMIRFSDKDF